MIRRGRIKKGIAQCLARGSPGLAAAARPRRLSFLAALVTVLSVGALAGAGPAAAVPREFFGLVPQGAAPSSADIQRMGQGRVGTVRMHLNWGTVEPMDDRFQWATFDAYVGDLAAAGIQPYPFVWGVPQFISGDGRALPVGSPAAEAQWQEFLREAVRRYGPGGRYWTSVFPAQHPGAQPKPIEVWQVWNEQNAPKHTQPLSASAYARLLTISHSAIASQDPKAEIVLGGMFGRPTGAGAFNAWRFLNDVYKSRGVKKSFDGIALHPYSPNIGGIKKQIRKVRKVLKKRKDKKADIWVTELGWGSHGRSTSRLIKGVKGQARLLKKSFKLLKSKQARRKWNVRGVMWYTWRDLNPAGSPCDWCASAGLYGPSGQTPKRAWKAYVRFTGGS